MPLSASYRFPACFSRIALAALMALALTLSGCADYMTKPRYGIFRGQRPEPEPEPPFDIRSSKFDTRWFPAYVRWAPDDSHLLVSLCHVNRTEYCRIGKYWLAEKRWELLELWPTLSYRWPSYSPDGKSIVVTAYHCDTNYHCSGRLNGALVLLGANGRLVRKLKDANAYYPSFSADGKKIIYWDKTRITNVAQYDLTTGNSQMLTQLSLWGSDAIGPAFFLPGGERFMFAATLGTAFPSQTLIKDGKVVYKNGKPVDNHPLNDTKLDLEGPNRGVHRYVADIRNGVVDVSNIARVDLLWPDGMPATGGGAEDVSRSGEILYYSHPAAVAARKAAGIYHGALPQVGKSVVFFLRPAYEDAKDSVTFVIPISSTPNVVAISDDRRRLAFVLNENFWHISHRFGIFSLDSEELLFIDWPRLELDPAAMQKPAPAGGN